MNIEGIELLLNSQKRVMECECDDFWALIDCLKIEHDAFSGKHGFYHNRSHLLESFRLRKLFLLSYQETDELFKEREKLMPHILEGTFDALPAFCTLNSDNEIDIIWTHERYRNMGYATTFIDFFCGNANIEGDEHSMTYRGKISKHVGVIVPEAVEFWSNRGFTWNACSR